MAEQVEPFACAFPGAEAVGFLVAGE